MTADTDTDLKAGRRRVARSRGALSGILLIVLGAWAALIPFLGPYFKFAYSPNTGDAWHWTSGRGLYEVLPGGVAVLAGLLLLFSASRFLTVLFASLAAAAGAWLVVATPLSDIVKVSPGAPGATVGSNKAALEQLLFFYAIGAAIVLVAGIALGRLSTHSVRDVRAAERRAEAEAAEERRFEDERRAAAEAEAARAEEQRRHAERPVADERPTADSETRTFGRQSADDATATLPAVGGEHGHHAVEQRPAGDRVPDAGSYDDRAPEGRPDDDRTAAIPTRPADTAGPRDPAGSSGYLGHRAAPAGEEQPPRNT